jgi:hypothetical protein
MSPASDEIIASFANDLARESSRRTTFGGREGEMPWDRGRVQHRCLLDGTSFEFDVPT